MGLVSTFWSEELAENCPQENEKSRQQPRSRKKKGTSSLVLLQGWLFFWCHSKKSLPNCFHFFSLSSFSCCLFVVCCQTGRKGGVESTRAAPFLWQTHRRQGRFSSLLFLPSHPHCTQQTRGQGRAGQGQGQGGRMRKM